MNRHKFTVVLWLCSLFLAAGFMHSKRLFAVVVPADAETREQSTTVMPFAQATAAQNNPTNQPQTVEASATVTETQAITGVIPTRAAPAPKLTLVIGTSFINDANSNNQIDPGDTIRYGITLRNEGTVAATQVQLVANYDERLVQRIPAESISPDGQDDRSQLAWEIGTVEAGAESVRVFDIELKRTLAAGTMRAYLLATLVSQETPLISQEHTFNISAAPILAATVERAAELVMDGGTAGEIDPGDTVQILIKFRNTGNADAVDLTLTSTYAVGLIATVNKVSGEGTDTGSALVWQLAQVEAGGEGMVSYDVTLKPTLPARINQITTQVTLVNRDEIPLVEAQTSFSVVATPQLRVTSEQVPDLLVDNNDNGQADPGDTVRFKIIYANDGSANATGVKLIDKYDGNWIESVDNIGDAERVNGQEVVWNLGTVQAGTSALLSYDTVLASRFPTGTTVLENITTLTSNEGDSVHQERSFTVEVLPETQVADGASPVSAAAVNTVIGPAGGPFSTSPWVPVFFIGLLALGAMGVFTYVGAMASFGSNEKDALGQRRVAMVREGVFLVFIVSSILILTLADDLESDGAISILSAIVGYVFGRVSSSS